jgi:IclR family pca regulon transcriptional regulator
MSPKYDTSKDKTEGPVGSLSRGLAILSFLSKSQTAVSLTEFGRELQLTKSTIQRLTAMLVKLEYLSRDSATKRFTLGPRLVGLGFSVLRSLDLGKVALPLLERTSLEVGECSSLGIQDGSEVVYVARIKTKHLLNLNIEVGSRVPVCHSALGKAIIAYLPPSRLEEMLNGVDLTGGASQSIKSKEDLLKELEHVRIRGFSMNVDELSVGVRSVAAPVRDHAGKVIAAVNIAGPSARVSRSRLETDLAKKVRRSFNTYAWTLLPKDGVKEIFSEYKCSNMLFDIRQQNRIVLTEPSERR